MAHSEAKAAFIGKLDKYEQFEGAFPEGCIRIAFPYPTIETDKQWNELLTNTSEHESYPARALDDMKTIIYTSGSTGKPKGVVHSFRTIANGSMHYVLDINDASSLGDERYLSYLPLAHITERVVGLGVWLYSYEIGATMEISFVESLDTFAKNLQETEPTVFVSVPRLWQKFQSGVFAKFPKAKLDFLLKVPIVSGIIKKKIREGLGFKHTRLWASGSAPIAPSLLAWYESIGVNISQGWGMTETAATGTSQAPYRSDKRDSIGRSLHGQDIRIGDEQEIQIKSDSVFTEYYKQPELNAEVFTEDGYFKTGDQGVMDADGYIKIIGRIKDIFKTDKGKYVAPAPIEAKLAKCVLLEQICVVGTNLPQPLVLAVPDPSVADMDKSDVNNQLEALIKEMNSELENHERLDGIILMREPWTVENGLITPTLKIKRQVIEKRFEEVYSERLTAKVVWQ